MTKHVHAELIAELAKDALETDTPWERWEYAGPNDSFFTPCLDMPMFRENWKYRRKPKTVRIGEFDVPMPISDIRRSGYPVILGMFYEEQENAELAAIAIRRLFFPEENENN